MLQSTSRVLVAISLSSFGMDGHVEAFLASPLRGSTQHDIVRRAPMTKVHMWDVPQNNEGDTNSDTNSRWLDDLLSEYGRPPPAPEDLFVMTGDLLSLCVYGITDHLLCQVFSRMMVEDTLSDPMHLLSQAAASQVPNGVSGHALQAPVWLDLHTQYTNHVLEVTLSNQLITKYSPVLEPMGQATCVLIGCWLLAGWFHQAFSFRNTLDCSTERALTVTARTWLTTCAMLFGIVLVSQKLCGCDHFYLIQRGDLDYIVDSASVLVLWRFLASYMLGSGSDE